MAEELGRAIIDQPANPKIRASPPEGCEDGKSEYDIADGGEPSDEDAGEIHDQVEPCLALQPGLVVVMMRWT